MPQIKHPIEAILTNAEKRIQSILLDLVNERGCRIFAVDVDTRAFANLAVEIKLLDYP